MLDAYLNGILLPYFTHARTLWGCSVYGSELSQWLQSPLAAFAFFLVTLDPC